MRLIQIAPQPDPASGGVASYAAALAGGLVEICGVASELVIADSGDTLERELGSADSVLLHYVNYAYHPRGCPRWLVGGMRRWQTHSPNRRLVTFFHEVYATGPPWRSSFWLSPVQRQLAAALARTSDRSATSLELYADMLRPWIPGREITVQPVFSTVGEAAAVTPLQQREPRMVVFGSAGVRGRAYTLHRQALATACRDLRIAEIVDVGSPTAAAPPAVEGLPIRRLGTLPSAEVSALLLDSVAGFLAYPPAFLPKSTIFAAYCAHGVLPVCSWSQRRGVQPSTEEPTYWAPGGQSAGPAQLQAIASQAHAWYSGHTLARQAIVFGDLLAGGDLP